MPGTGPMLKSRCDLPPRPGTTVMLDAASTSGEVADAQLVLAVIEHAPAVDFRLADASVVERAGLAGGDRVEQQANLELLRPAARHDHRGSDRTPLTPG